MSYKYKPMSTRRKPVSESSKGETDFTNEKSYKSFGYYVLGGLDVTGEQLQLDADVSYDSDSDISSGCAVDALCSPNTSFMHIAESMGVETAERLASEVQNK